MLYNHNESIEIFKYTTHVGCTFYKFLCGYYDGNVCTSHIAKMKSQQLVCESLTISSSIFYILQEICFYILVNQLIDLLRKQITICVLLLNYSIVKKGRRCLKQLTTINFRHQINTKEL